MLERVLARGLPTAICTIDYPRFPEPAMQRLAITELTIFNDCILLEAISRSLTVLDLRLICNHDDDFANAIEPSVAGGDKIAGAISEFLSNHDFRKGRCEIFSRGRIEPPETGIERCFLSERHGWSGEVSSRAGRVFDRIGRADGRATYRVRCGSGICPCSTIWC